MRRVFFILLLFVSVAVQAQRTFFKRIDSLKNALAQSREDANRVKVYHNLGFAYVYENQDSAIFYANAGLNLARKLEYIQGEIVLLTVIGEALAMKQDFAKGLELKLEALQKAEAIGDSALIGGSYNFIGVNYLLTEDYETALTYFKKIMAYTGFWQWQNKYQYGQLGACYLKLNKLDSAYYYTKQAYDLDQKDTQHWETVYENMGDIEQKRGNYSEALKFFRMQQNVTGFPNVGMASTFKKLGQRDSAIYYAEALLASNEWYIPSKLTASSLLTELYKSSGALDSAFKYQELMLALTDSSYSQEKIKQLKNIEFNERQRQEQVKQVQREAQQQYKARVRTYSLLAGLAVLALLAFVLYRNNRLKQRTNALLEQKNLQIENTLLELKATQAQLIQSEKMASLGELTAGIAHEIQNPLNFVNNFSETNVELLQEAEIEIKLGNIDEGLSALSDIKSNNEKINNHGKRADSIVKSMLEHSRTTKGEKQLTDINALLDEYLRLAYHGFRAMDKTFNATIKSNLDENIGKVNIVPQEIGRVLLNLFNNAFYAVAEKVKQAIDNYEPKVEVSSKRETDKIKIIVKDNGTGIPENALDKVFQPFFTTKSTGQGTGLGLSLSYDIIKALGGDLKVESKEGEGAVFTILLPLSESIKIN